ncbi:MAG TPA: site-2 protease family protein, partial [Myxococcales bacterium]|nr:site-2 protease family protein [Myxococcales bacterium]
MLRFRFGPFPVTVYLSFLVAAALLSYLWIDPGSISSTDGVALFFAYVVIVFVSVLVHELGHALVGRAFGGSPEIRLEGFGGVTYPRLQERPSAWKQVVLSIAGPVAGLGLGILATAIARAFPPERGSPTANVLALVQWTSVGWAILNLLPVLPLDGGHVLQAFLEGVRRRPSFALASWISAIVAGAVAIFGWYVLRSPFLAIWFALFAINNLTRARLGGQTAQSAPPRRASPLEAERVDVERELERARAAILAADEDTALSAAASLEESEGPYRQAAGLRIRAGVELARGNNQAAGLHAGRSYTLWQSADAAVVAARANLRAGERERAENWLKRA